MKISLQEIFKKISETINSEYSLTGLGLHRGLKGTKREKILQNFLKDNLPDQYNVGDGEIFDSQGVVSKQMDIIIYNRYMPVFRYSRYLHFFPIESVFGVCEVKTKLNKHELEKAVLNVQSAKQMLLSKPSVHFGDFHDRVYGAIFAFKSIEPQKLKKYLADIYVAHDIPELERIDMICVLDDFIALDNLSKDVLSSKEKPGSTGPSFWDTKKDSLMYFVPILIDGFNVPISHRLDFDKYIGELDIKKIA